MVTTSQIYRRVAKWLSGNGGDKKGGLQKGANIELSGITVTAKGISYSPTPQEEQKAKDFIWIYLDRRNRELLVEMANTDALSRHRLSVKKICLGLQYNRQ